jgi:GDP-mannose 6-dehydrogenase
MGLGPVGLVWAAFLLDKGHSVMGYDINRDHIDRLKTGELSILEPGLVGQMFTKSHFSAQERLEPQENFTAAFICLSIKEADDILTLKKYISEFHELGTKHIYVRSTIPLSFSAEFEKIVSFYAELDCVISYFPEFMREGSARSDLETMNIILGRADPSATELLEKIIPGRTISECSVSEAIVLKLVSNAWHGLKVCFANEVGEISKSLGANSQKVMDLFCEDKILNLSKYYLVPGAPFGGSCLEKDVQFINDFNGDLEIFGSILPSNRRMCLRLHDQIVASKAQRIIWLGPAFKPGVNDQRNSIALTISESLRTAGLEVRLCGNENLQEILDEWEPELIVLGSLTMIERDIYLIKNSRIPILDLGYDPKNRSLLGEVEGYERI